MNRATLIHTELCSWVRGFGVDVNAVELIHAPEGQSEHADSSVGTIVERA